MGQCPHLLQGHLTVYLETFLIDLTEELLWHLVDQGKDVPRHL